jgi:hypothetical protein
MRRQKIQPQQGDKKVKRITCFAVVALCTVFAAVGNASMEPRMGLARPKILLGDQSALGNQSVMWQALHGKGAQDAPANDPSIAAPAQGPAIVGLWRVTFVSDGQVVDEGFDIWHSDGTEVLNDNPPPATGNVCVGVWSQTGGRTFKLKHLSWSYDMNGNLNGTVIIREQVAVDTSGASFKGTFKIDAFDLTGNPVFHIDGQLTGERITTDDFD